MQLTVVVGADWTLHPWRHNSSNVGGVTVGQAKHNSSNVEVVTAGQVRYNSSLTKDTLGEGCGGLHGVECLASTIIIGRRSRNVYMDGQQYSKVDYHNLRCLDRP